jgi:hypothetical protein
MVIFERDGGLLGGTVEVGTWRGEERDWWVAELDGSVVVGR